MSEIETPQSEITEKIARFEADGRLLQELGERLVARPEIALLELIKNSYDADSRECIVSYNEDNNTISIKDNGTGMSEREFLNKWMRIATSNKVITKESNIYKRRMTGQKGIGRFAVRFLGDYLKLDTVSASDGNTVRLVAEFPWTSFDQGGGIDATDIHYSISQAGASIPGTTLTIGDLKRGNDFLFNTALRSNILKLVSPFGALDGGRHNRRASNPEKGDPGFVTKLPNLNADAAQDISAIVLNNYWARLRVVTSGTQIKYRVSFDDDKIDLNELVYEIPDIAIKDGLTADIRYFPRRTGLFRDIGVDGREARGWVKDHSGVAVFDHSFRVSPFGLGDDDWLDLIKDDGISYRQWRSKIMNELMPIQGVEFSDPSLNPMLNLARSHQLVGAVFVISTSEDEDLIPAIGREGFIKNKAYADLKEIIRGGLEYLAKLDKTRQLKQIEEERENALKQLKTEFSDAIKYIESSPTLTQGDKQRISGEYARVAKRVQDVESYDTESRRRLEVMSSLGVIAGFVTHETSRIISILSEAEEIINGLAKNYPTLIATSEKIHNSSVTFQNQLSYIRMFTDANKDNLTSSFKARAQINVILKALERFTTDRNICIINDCDNELLTPQMPIAAYSGILLNLLSNAVKAVIAQRFTDEQPTIRFHVYNDKFHHTVEVMDNGTGIPDSIRNRIWDPLFTTTSRFNNPLGSGMGLGLNLVKQLVEQMKGKIELIKPSLKFSTCFRVTLPLK